MSAPTASTATTYPQLRQQFLAAAQKHQATLFAYPHPLKGMQGEDIWRTPGVTNAMRMSAF